jgi:hypothetical protein
MERLSEAHRRLVQQNDEQWIGKALDPAALPPALQANAPHMAHILLDKTVARRATTAAIYAEQVIDATLASLVTGPIACARGCHHCCHTFVSATIPEIFRVAQAMGAKPAKVARVASAAARAKTIPQLQREVDRIDCPMLEDGACSEYLDRPMVCRAVLSRSLDTCLRIFEQRSGEAFAHPEHSMGMRMYLAIAMQTALILGGLPHRHYDFVLGLEVALTQPDAEERWLAGEPLFDGVPIDLADSYNAKLAEIVSKMVDAVRPTL